MFKRLRKYLQESWGELKKLNYPKREEVINATIVIIGFSLVMAAFLGAVDIFSNAGSRWLIGTAAWAAKPNGTMPDFHLGF